MVIERIELRVLRLPLVRFFETSFGRVHDRTFMLVRIDGGGVTAWGECVADSDPFYGPETVKTAWHITDGLPGAARAGRPLRASPRRVSRPFAASAATSMAKAAVEMAAWDLYARQEGKPLAAVLGGTRTRVAAGVSIGIQDSLEQLVDRVGAELADGLPARQDQGEARVGPRAPSRPCGRASARCR